MKISRTLTIPRCDFDLYQEILDGGERLDEYAYNEPLEKFYANFPDNIEAIIEFINSDPTCMKVTWKQGRTIICKKNYTDHIEQRICFQFNSNELVIDIVRY